MVITIDGTSGSGKTFAGTELAKALNCAFLSSGEIYRAIALVAINNNADLANENNLIKALQKSKIEIKTENNFGVFYINNEKISYNTLHSPEISSVSAKISPFTKIREFARSLQHHFADNSANLVIEGRDIGSVVFPNADIKFYLTANLKTRAERRLKEFKEAGKQITYKEVYSSLKKRDFLDKSRELGKLVIPKGAIKINTTSLSKKEVKSKLLSAIKK